ncbi:MAG: hypothetical protein M3081_02525 [Gemmatimonadota bacterium]|nr:hypothetical protein [Gemmatimonadota bacterium]
MPQTPYMRDREQRPPRPKVPIENDPETQALLHLTNLPLSAVVPREQTFLERHGLNDPHVVKSLLWSICIGLGTLALAVILGAYAGQPLGKLIIWGIIGGVCAGCLVTVMTLGAARMGENVSRSIYAPHSTGTPHVDFSLQESMAMRGDIAGALASYEALIATSPADAAARFRAAELYLRSGGSPARAAELFAEVRAIPKRTAGDDMYATNRLIDLYSSGPLRDDTKMLRELRGLAERHPGTKIGEDARAAYERMKTEG